VPEHEQREGAVNRQTLNLIIGGLRQLGHVCLGVPGDAVQQIMALYERRLAPYLGEDDAALTERLLGLRGWALWFLNELADSFAQAIDYGEPLLTDCEEDGQDQDDADKRPACSQQCSQAPGP